MVVCGERLPQPLLCPVALRHLAPRSLKTLIGFVVSCCGATAARAGAASQFKWPRTQGQWLTPPSLDDAVATTERGAASRPGLYS